jgi:hypothetical protein
MPVSPDYSADLAKPLLELYEAAEARLLERIARMLARGIDAPRWAEQQLLMIQQLRQQTEILLTQLTATATATAATVLVTSYNRGAALAGADLRRVGTPRAIAFGGVDTRAVGVLLDHTKSSFGSMVLPIQSQQINMYRGVIESVAGQMLAGSVTRRQAAVVAVADWADKGVVGFVDRAGRPWEMAAYAETVTRTSAAQAIIGGHVDRLREAGHDLVMISDAPEECKRCRPFEGKILSIRDGVGAGPREVDGHRFNVLGSLAWARQQGLFHPNCRHRTTVYLPGITQPLHDTEDPEGDALRQKQRAWERKIRALKRKAIMVGELAPGSPEAKAVNTQLRVANRNFKTWRDDNGRKHLPGRVALTAR